MKKISIALLLITTISCNHQNESNTGNVDTSQVAAIHDSVIQTPEVRGKMYRGLFVSSATLRLFKSCDDPDQRIMVIDSTHSIDSLYRQTVKQSLSFPNEYMYVEAEGNMSSASPGDKKYDGVLTIYRIDTFKRRDYNNTCIPYEFWAIGKTPHWSLQISRKEKLIALKDFAAKRVYLFPYFEPIVVNGEIFTYRTENTATSESLQAVIRKQPCNDKTSPTTFLYSARVIRSGKVYQGCAIEGNSVNF